jgi:hypothetical protein
MELLFASLVAGMSAFVLVVLFSYTDIMFNYLQTAAATALTPMFNGVGTTAGNYNALYDGTLVGIDLFVIPQAATSLCQSGRIEITSSSFTPNKNVIAFSGFGLATAPQSYGGTLARLSYPLNQPVKTAVPITAAHLSYSSPVTPNFLIQGYFTSS